MVLSASELGDHPLWAQTRSGVGVRFFLVVLTDGVGGAERTTLCSFAMRPDLHHRLKVAAAVHQRDMSEILEQALTQLLTKLDAKEK